MTIHDATEKAHEQEILARVHLRGEVAKLKELLRSLEWRGHCQGADACPVCYAEAPYEVMGEEGHLIGCELFKAIQ